MATGRESRMQQRMRGAQRHQVQEAEFDLFFDLPTGLDAAPPVEADALPTEPTPAPALAQSPPQSEPDQTTPGATRRKRTDDGGSAKDAATESAASQIAARAVGSQPSQEEISESPLLEPGSGRRRSIIATAAAASRTAALHQAVSGDVDASPSSGRGKGKARGKDKTKGKAKEKKARAASADTSSPQEAPRRDEPSPELSTMIQVPSSAGLGITNNGPTDDAADELSSPAFGSALEPVDDITMSGMMPSSSPLARKSTTGVRAAAKRAFAAAAQTTISETPLAGRVQTMEEPDELSPDQPAHTQQQRTGRPLQARQASEVPSSSPVMHVAKRMSSQKTARLPRSKRTIPTVEEEPEPEAEQEEQPPPQEEVEENEEAEEIDAVEAARTIGKKRPRRSTVHEPSPELGSQPVESEAAAAVSPVSPVSPEADARPSKKRRQRDQDHSPSAQSQPRLSKKASKSSKPDKSAKPVKENRTSTAAPAEKKQRKQKRKRADRDGDDDDELEGGSRSRGAPVPITVQRYAKLRVSAARRSRSAGDASDDDELAAAGDMPFANRSGVNAVDVLAQVCEDIVEQKLQQLQGKYEQVREQAANEEDGGSAAAVSAARKDIQAARRALESLQQELRTRLLEQAVAVDTLYAMRKRVRAVHKEKLALREEILRIRSERDQVGLRMDALRAQHQQRVRQAMKTTQMSAAMFDVDLAVEQGRAAPELTPAQQKAAELANLELVVRRIASQVSGRSNHSSGETKNNGGTLHQIKEFNDFLERAAAVLEGRRLPAKAVAA